MIEYLKRIEGGKLLQIWLKISDGEGIKMYAHTCEMEYYGEGFRDSDLERIDIEEFRELGRRYGCLVKSSILPLPNISVISGQ